MRSRTELVTTTFIDSEEDQSESDDSEEDWRPSHSGKRRMAKLPKARRKKRSRLNVPPVNQPEDWEQQDHQHSMERIAKARDYLPGHEQSSATAALVAEQQYLLDKFAAERSASGRSSNAPFELYLYKKDLDEKYRENSHLCLWRRDGVNLLQKYIRVKTTNPDEFIFTTSSVYSSWDDRRRKDFTTITVKYLEENNRRVTLYNPIDLANLANEAIARKRNYMEDDKQLLGNMSVNPDKEEDEGEEEEDYDDDTDDEYEEDEEDGVDDSYGETSDEDDEVPGIVPHASAASVSDYRVESVSKNISESDNSDSDSTDPQ